MQWEEVLEWPGQEAEQVQPVEQGVLQLVERGENTQLAELEGAQPRQVVKVNIQ